MSRRGPRERMANKAQPGDRPGVTCAERGVCAQPALYDEVGYVLCGWAVSLLKESAGVISAPFTAPPMAGPLPSYDLVKSFALFSPNRLLMLSVVHYYSHAQPMQTPRPRPDMPSVVCQKTCCYRHRRTTSIRTITRAAKVGIYSKTNNL